VSLLPEFLWASLRIIAYIEKAASRLDSVAEACVKGQVDTQSLAHLLDPPYLNDINVEDTTMSSVTTNDGRLLRFILRTIKGDAEASIYSTDPFVYWDNLCSRPVLRRYVGSRHLLFNRSANCAKAIAWPETRIFFDTCNDKDFRDPALNQWETLREVQYITEEKSEFQMKTDMRFNYIYCFPGNLSIQKVEIQCPPRVFKLPGSIGFRFGDIVYEPAVVAKNVTVGNDLIMQIHLTHLNESFTETKELEKFRRINMEIQELKGWEKMVYAGGGSISLAVVCVIAVVGSLLCCIYFHLKSRKISKPSNNIELNILSKERKADTPAPSSALVS